MQPFHEPNGVFVGRDLGGHEYEITRAAVERYAAGTGDRHAWYGNGAPEGRPLAPALLYHSEVYTNLGWYLPNIFGNLHARQEWALLHPMYLGDRVHTRSTVVERYRKRSRDYVVNEVLITDAGGRWLQRSRTHQSFLIDDERQGFAVDRGREKRGDRTFAVGDGQEPQLTPLAKTASLAMCEAFSGPDKNYHTDREMARALGFPDIVVQGMMSVCFISELMTREFGMGWFCGGRLDVNLVNVLWGEETVAVRAAVSESCPEGDKTRVRCDVWCEKTDGTKTVVGTASALRA